MATPQARPRYNIVKYEVIEDFLHQTDHILQSSGTMVEAALRLSPLDEWRRSLLLTVEEDALTNAKAVLACIVVAKKDPVKVLIFTADGVAHSESDPRSTVATHDANKTPTPFSLLVDFLVVEGIAVPARRVIIVGPSKPVEELSRRWAGVGQLYINPSVTEHTLHIEEVPAHLSSPRAGGLAGNMRKATLAGDGTLLSEWYSKCVAEYPALVPNRQQLQSGNWSLSKALEDGQVYVWETPEPEKEVLAMAVAVVKPTCAGEISLFYTPPRHRRKGATKALLSALTAHLLNNERCCLVCVFVDDLIPPEHWSWLRKSLGYEYDGKFETLLLDKEKKVARQVVMTPASHSTAETPAGPANGSSPTSNGGANAATAVTVSTAHVYHAPPPSSAPPVAASSANSSNGTRGPRYIFKIPNTIPVGSSAENLFTAYLVERHDTTTGQVRTTLKRYREFHWLDEHLRREHPGLKLPKFTPKKLIGSTKKTVVAKRQKQLEEYLNEVAKMGILDNSVLFETWLTTECLEKKVKIKVPPTDSSSTS